MKEFKFRSSLEATCYHEAGHAVMLYYFGVPINSIEIYTPHDGMVHCNNYCPSAIYQKNQCSGFYTKEANFGNFLDNMRMYTFINLSGYIAECRYNKQRLKFGLTSENIGNDFYDIQREISQFNSISIEHQYHPVILYMVEKEVRNFVKRKKIWFAITTLANCLIDLWKSNNGLEVELKNEVINSILEKIISNCRSAFYPIPY